MQTQSSDIQFPDFSPEEDYTSAIPVNLRLMRHRCHLSLRHLSRQIHKRMCQSQLLRKLRKQQLHAMISQQNLSGENQKTVLIRQANWLLALSGMLIKKSCFFGHFFNVFKRNLLAGVCDTSGADPTQILACCNGNFSDALFLLADVMVTSTERFS